MFDIVPDHPVPPPLSDHLISAPNHFHSTTPVPAPYSGHPISSLPHHFDSTTPIPLPHSNYLISAHLHHSDPIYSKSSSHLVHL